MTIAIIVIGAAVSSWGIISGNVAANRMWDEVEEKTRAEAGMFSGGTELNPVPDRRMKAVREYRASNPDSGKVRKLRNGQILSVAGCLVMITGFFI